jgi:hypothetical protein
MASKIECPKCGETKNLKGERDGQVITITCHTCEHSWVRDPDVCPSCGQRKIVRRRMPLYQKARGTQQSIIGYSVARDCRACGWSSGGDEEKSAVV